MCRYLDEKIPIHVLHFETLRHDFNRLMGDYGLPIELKDAKQRTGVAVFTVADLDAATVALIRSAYSDDFRLFGYSQDPADLQPREVCIC